MGSVTQWHQISLLLANVLIPVAVLTFATGFFPYKPFVPGLAEYESTIYGEPPAAQFDKLVFMVVDALRSDFVFGHGSGFTFTQRYVKIGSAQFVVYWQCMLTLNLQSNPFRRSHAIHRARDVSYDHDASCEGHHDRLDTFILGRDPQLR